MINISNNKKTNDDQYILKAYGIKKHFGGLYALNNVSFNLKPNEILGIVGDNGAGKSTLIKIISGIIKRDEGDIYFEGKKVDINKPQDATKLGIETVYQDLRLVDTQNAPFNIFLGREKTHSGLLKYIGMVNERAELNESLKLLSRLNINLGNLKKPMIEYSGGQRQAVALSKAVYWGTRIVILDEPTAALGVNESRKALDLIKTLKEVSKISIIIISHNMQHIFSIVDRIMVLRRGELITVQDIHNVTASDIVKYITGAEEVIERV